MAYSNNHSRKSRRNGVSASGKTSVRPGCCELDSRESFRNDPRGGRAGPGGRIDFYTYGVKETIEILACFNLPEDGPTDLQLAALIDMFPRLSAETINEVYNCNRQLS